MMLGAPWMLLWLLALAPAGWLVARGRRAQREAACRLKGVTPERAPLQLNRRDCLALAALGCTVLALARPQWNPQPFDVERRGRDLILVLDVSRSMLAADVAPSRLEAARIAIHEALPAWAGQRIALVTFAGSAAVRVPLTLDHGFVRYMLERADPSDLELGSTSLQAAFEKALGAVLSDAVRGRCDLVMFTDGEDHLSDLDQTAALVAGSGARALIVGLGDPAQGEHVPDPSGAGSWMQYQNAAVVSRLEENTLAELTAKCPKATYYPARTRPFDLAALYQGLISGARGDVASGELRRVRYAEGYPFLLVLAVALWLAASPLNRAGFGRLLPLILLLASCTRPADEQAAFQAKLRQGSELREHAQEQSGLDLAAARALLLDAREAFLDAGLLRPGDFEAARQVTAVTRRLREWDAKLEKLRAAEEKRQAKLGELIRQLERLALRQSHLSGQSARWLTRRIVPPDADLSTSGESDNDMTADESLSSTGNDRRLAAAAAKEQQAVHAETARVMESVTFQRHTLRQLLAHSYGGTGRELPTELDPAAHLLAGAQSAQQQALASLGQPSLSWPKANTAFHVAAGQLQQALEALRSLQPPAKDQDENAQPPMNGNETQDGLDGEAAGDGGKKSPPLSPGDFATALALESLPIPNYSPAEILAEEAANQTKRARQKAARAGAKVEKNW